jgi:hypothetical protein
MQRQLTQPKKMEDNISFINMDSYRGSGNNSGITINQIVLMHVNRCVMNGSIEWTGGRWEHKVVQSGMGAVTEKKYIADTRETFINSVLMLRSLIIPYIKEDLKVNESEFENKQDIKRVNAYRVLFEELIKVCHNKNWFNEVGQSVTG